MTRQYRILIAAVLLTLSAHAQEAVPAGAPLGVRAFLIDPTHPAAELYLRDTTGDVVKLSLASMELGITQQTVPVNGSLVLFNTATFDPENPQPAVAASIAVPKNMKRAIVIIVPAPANATPAYRMVLIDDSPAAFPTGESRILSMVRLETAMEAGEHKLPCKSGAITPAPPVKKLDPYNMAQTNFYYKRNGSWIAFSECRMKYLDVFRQVFIVYMIPGSTAPVLTTLVDQAPRPEPAK
jgi:hypothetical protein